MSLKMAGSSTRIKTWYFYSVAVLFSCNTAFDTIDISEFRLYGSVIPGWVEDTSGYAEFDTSDIYDLIDGGAPPYIERGLLKGIKQEFDFIAGDDTFHCQTYAEDFGTSQNARNMLSCNKTQMSLSLTLYPFDTSTITGMEFPGGCLAIAAFDRYYFEVTVSGYPVIDSAKSEVRQFLSVYKAKASK